MSTTDIEKRLVIVEQEIARLKVERRRLTKPHPVEVLDQLHGIFKDDDAFQAATRLGRKWRKSQNSRARKSRAKRK